MVTAGDPVPVDAWEVHHHRGLNRRELRGRGLREGDQDREPQDAVTQGGIQAKGVDEADAPTGLRIDEQAA